MITGATARPIHTTREAMQGLPDSAGLNDSYMVLHAALSFAAVLVALDTTHATSLALSRQPPTQSRKPRETKQKSRMDLLRSVGRFPARGHTVFLESRIVSDRLRIHADAVPLERATAFDYTSSHAQPKPGERQ
ncbi:hypothetical protein ANAPC5_01452 [Anaplasma phagocytophilum]|nr:hypothetical protein ANAPC5_01452 [Anaplasma phagocytophilum]